MRFFVHIQQITVPILPFLRPGCASDPVIFKTVRKRIRHAFPKLTGKNAKSGAVTKQPGNPFQSNPIQSNPTRIRLLHTCRSMCSTTGFHARALPTLRADAPFNFSHSPRSCEGSRSHLRRSSGWENKVGAASTAPRKFLNDKKRIMYEKNKYETTYDNHTDPELLSRTVHPPYLQYTSVSFIFQ